MTGTLLTETLTSGRPLETPASNVSTAFVDLRDIFVPSGAKGLAAPDARVFVVCITPSYEVWRPETERLLSFQSINSPVVSLGSEATIERARPSWWDSIEQRFTQLRQLPNNWNSYGAEALDGATVDRALSLLSALAEPDTPEPSIVPAIKGGVQIEWHTLAGDLEIEAAPDGTLSVLFSESATAEELEPEHVTQQELRSLLQRTSASR